MSEDGDLYFLYDLVRDEETKPGEMISFRIRARDEQAARTCAANLAGGEGREAWEDEARSQFSFYGEAAVQWHGVVASFGHGHVLEEEFCGEAPWSRES